MPQHALMLLNLENISPLQVGCSSVEMALLTVRYGCPYQVVWIGIETLPTEDELRDIMQAILLVLTNATSRNIIVHFEHTSADDLRSPGLEFIKQVVSVLLDNKDLVKRSLCCSIFQARKIDDKMKIAVDLFMSLYKTTRPLLITDRPDEAESFAQKNCVPY